MNILVVEDERNLADAICHILNEAGYNAEATYDGRSGLTSAESGLYDAVVLDVMLPKMDGFQVVHELRRQGNSVTKPFEAPELLARLRALTRRQGDVMLDELTFADLKLDLTTHDLSSGDKSVHLSGKEFEVLRMLMSSTSRIVSKQDLLTRVWGADADASENSVEAYVSFLRKKVKHLGSKVQITTLRMLGYRLEVFENLGA